ncbi:MAG: hypothetical protein ACLP8A_10540 [Methylovirgula sp.]
MVAKCIVEIAETLMELAGPGVTPKQLFESVRKSHPHASRKEITRAAYYALISFASRNVETAGQMRELATVSRPTFGGGE